MVEHKHVLHFQTVPCGSLDLVEEDLDEAASVEQLGERQVPQGHRLQFGD